MAHQLPPSVNCSLDEIDLGALKVSTFLCIFASFKITFIDWVLAHFAFGRPLNFYHLTLK